MRIRKVVAAVAAVAALGSVGVVAAPGVANDQRSDVVTLDIKGPRGFMAHADGPGMGKLIYDERGKLVVAGARGWLKWDGERVRFAWYAKKSGPHHKADAWCKLKVGHIVVRSDCKLRATEGGAVARFKFWVDGKAYKVWAGVEDNDYSNNDEVTEEEAS